jgi:hypothetical protein
MNAIELERHNARLVYKLFAAFVINENVSWVDFISMSPLRK